MKPQLVASVLLLITVIGCDQSQTASRLSTLEASVAQLSKQLDEANKKNTSLEAAWKQFEQNFDAEKREALQKNIEALEGMLTRIEGEAKSSVTILSEVQQLQAEIVKLRDLCVKHESEAADANQIGKLKDAVATLSKDVKRIGDSLGPGPNLSQKVTRIESSIRTLESDLRSLKFKVR